MTAEELLSTVTYEAISLEHVPYDQVRHALKERHIVRVRGLFE